MTPRHGTVRVPQMPLARLGFSSCPCALQREDGTVHIRPGEAALAAVLPCNRLSYLRILHDIWFQLIRCGGDRHVKHIDLDDSRARRVLPCVPPIADVAVSEETAASFVSLRQSFHSARIIGLP